jgi:hypothetical protein
LSFKLFIMPFKLNLDKNNTLFSYVFSNNRILKYSFNNRKNYLFHFKNMITFL